MAHDGEGAKLASCRSHAILDNLRASVNGGTNKGPLKETHMQELDQVAERHLREEQSPTLAICGRHLPLLYRIASILVSPPHLFALLVIDLDGRFDATRLSCSDTDARHIYVHRPPRPSSYGCSAAEDAADEGGWDSGTDAGQLRSMIAEAGSFMLYGAGAAPSASRRWWGTAVVGGPGVGDIAAGWKGWLRVYREPVQAFALGMSAEEALERRSARQEAVDAAGWAAESRWGGFVFKDS
ncbi:hypothetical protein ACRE_023330 [Hapsidospora chrysogenum ATCC 11550]|uniref:Uncharacterized protein n=1 Tax=Hapsidospora chrysogenum (strain ATCC 11550 / CBS 779.69 / DSM 880 / IAM 14645 / JCM 23072 / IMI 49137) TaxID=857340 RepID=A0A086TBX3_HAPC1|nr:hypothetical protein ACRE_023330 [Hapsidospora chrysogenum ATCC 11550]